MNQPNGEPDKRELIIDAAARVFDRYGYDKASVSDIAAELGMGKGTIYYYIDSKEDLYLEVMKREVAETWHSLMNDFRGISNPSDKLRYYFLSPVKILARQAPLFLRYIQENHNIFHKKLERFRQEQQAMSHQRIHTILRDGVDQGIFRDDYDLDELVDILHRWFLFGKEKTEPDLSEEGMKILMRDYEVMVDLVIGGLMKKEDA